MLGRATAAVLALFAFAAPALAEATLKRIPTQYIAALGPTTATQGTDAATWGLWQVDPGPRGVRVRDFASLQAAGGIAPSGWTFDANGWWIEENGLIMEAPTFPLPAGRYVVTGGRETTAVLSVTAPDATGAQSWSLSDGATVYDVTHLRCRAAVYTPKDGAACTPDKTPLQRFPLDIGATMPGVDGCVKQDYQVLIVVGMMVDG